MTWNAFKLQEFQSGPDQCEDGPGVYRSPCSQQISMREYTQQSTELTHQAVQELKASVAFKMHTQQCHSCGTSWFDGQWNSDCSECGEGAMVMPCPICRGGCGTLWRRNTDMSRSTGVAHWDGQCAYPEDRVRVLLLRNVITQPTEDELSEALGDLGK
ncbi:hypothetical protein EMCRGX_G014244 [Ephydatia muelleri]